MEIAPSAAFARRHARPGPLSARAARHHYTILLSEHGAKAVASEVRELLV
jgi:hypothetical protein